MQYVFIISGFGMPKDILKDENYNFYLKMVFNRIWDRVLKDNPDNVCIVFTGGKTSPFDEKLSEAGEMKRFWMQKMIKERAFIAKKVRKWKIWTERRALSSYENLAFSKDLLIRKLSESGVKFGKEKIKIFIFTEWTRQRKVRYFAKQVFHPKYFSTQIIGIDFDISPNRYLDPEYIKQKEKVDIKLTNWAMQSPENFKKYHKIFEDRIKYIRKNKDRHHPQVVKEWWDMKLKEFFETNKIKI